MVVTEFAGDLHSLPDRARFKSAARQQLIALLHRLQHAKERELGRRQTGR